MLPNGMSKGCGIVEFSTRDEAQRAIQTLSNTNFMGRQIFIREDREQEPRFAASHRGGYNAGGYGGYARGGYGGGAGHQDTQGRQIFVGNVKPPFTHPYLPLPQFLASTLVPSFPGANTVMRGSWHTQPAGKTLRTSSVNSVTSSAPTSTSAQTVDPAAQE